MRFSFDPLDPFPLLEDLEGSYEAAKEHSARVDEFLGFRINEVEAGLCDRQVPWANLPASTLLTPYTELRYLLERLGPLAGERIFELGSGYSRLAHVLGRHWPEASYEGAERVPERAREAERVLRTRGIFSARVICADVLTLQPFPEADAYFLYDLNSDLAGNERVLERLAEEARRRPIRVIGRGRATRTLIERKHPWLSGVRDPEHCGNFSIYRS
jgi:hypothetical protein